MNRVGPATRFASAQSTHSGTVDNNTLIFGIGGKTTYENVVGNGRVEWMIAAISGASTEWW